MKDIAVRYFHSIFQSNGRTEATRVIEAIQPVVTSSMNDALVMEFKAEEVHKALSQMHPKKHLARMVWPLSLINIIGP